MPQTLEERVARLEVITENLDRRMAALESSIVDLNKNLSAISAQLASLHTELRDLKEGLDRQRGYSMWRIGLLVSVVTAAVDVVIYALTHVP